MPDQSAPVTRARGNRVLFWLLALAVSMAAAAAATFLRVSFLGLGLLVSLVLYGTLAWFFGHYERPLWWVAAPLLFLGDALFGWAWSVAVQGGSRLAPSTTPGRCSSSGLSGNCSSFWPHSPGAGSGRGPAAVTRSALSDINFEVQH